VPTEPDSAPTPDRAARHDPTGLDLARSIAKAIGATPKRWASRSRSSPSPRRRRHVDPMVSGAYPDDRDPQPLDAAMDRLVAEHGWTTDVAVHGVFARWDRIVGRDVAQHCRPEAYSDGRLVIRADSTAWATQVRLLAPTVVRRLNEELGDQTVRVVQVVGPSSPSWTKGRWSVRDGRGPRDTYG
jgi:predicted nucleic acid-binding Zn ribbon protein